MAPPAELGAAIQETRVKIERLEKKITRAREKLVKSPKKRVQYDYEIKENKAKIAILQKKLAEYEANTVQEQPNLDAQDEPNIQEQEEQGEQEEHEEQEVLCEVNHEVNQPNLGNAAAVNQPIMHEHHEMQVRNNVSENGQPESDDLQTTIDNLRRENDVLYEKLEAVKLDLKHEQRKSKSDDYVHIDLPQTKELEDLDNKYQKEHTALLQAEENVKELEKKVDDLKRAKEDVSNELTEVQTKLEQKETKLTVTLENLEGLEIRFIENNKEHDTHLQELNDKYKKEHNALVESKENVKRLKEEIVKLEKEKEDMSVQELEDLNNKYQQEHIARLHAEGQVEELEKKVDDLERANEELSNELTEVQTKLEQKETKLDAILETLEKVEMQFIEKNVEHDTQFAELSSKYQNNHAKLLQANQQIDMLRNSMSRLENEKESVQNEMEELRRALDVTREDLGDATKANEQMEDEMRSLANGKEELENELNEELQKMSLDHNNLVHETEDLQGALNEARENLRDVNYANDQMEDEIRKLATAKEEVENELTEAQNSVYELERRQSEHGFEEQKLRREYQILDNKLKDEIDSKQEMQYELRTLNKERGHLETQLLNTKEEMKKLEEKSKKTTEQLAYEKSIIDGEKKILSAEVKDLEEDVDQKDLEIVGYITKIGELKTKIKELEHREKVAAFQLKKKSEQVSSTQNSEYMELRESYDTVVDDVKDKVKQIKVVQDQNMALQKEMSKIKEQEERNRKEMMEKDLQHNGNIEKLGKYDTQITILQVTIADQKRELTTVRSQLEETNGAVVEYMEDMEKLKQDKERVSRQLKAKDEKTKNQVQTLQGVIGKQKAEITTLKNQAVIRANHGDGYADRARVAGGARNGDVGRGGDGGRSNHGDARGGVRGRGGGAGIPPRDDNFNFPDEHDDRDEDHELPQRPTTGQQTQLTGDGGTERDTPAGGATGPRSSGGGGGGGGMALRQPGQEIGELKTKIKELEHKEKVAAFQLKKKSEQVSSTQNSEYIELSEAYDTVVSDVKNKIKEIKHVQEQNMALQKEMSMIKSQEARNRAELMEKELQHNAHIENLGKYDRKINILQVTIADQKKELTTVRSQLADTDGATVKYMADMEKLKEDKERVSRQLKELQAKDEKTKNQVKTPQDVIGKQKAENTTLKNQAHIRANHGNGPAGRARTDGGRHGEGDRGGHDDARGGARGSARGRGGGAGMPQRDDDYDFRDEHDDRDDNHEPPQRPITRQQTQLTGAGDDGGAGRGTPAVGSTGGGGGGGMALRQPGQEDFPCPKCKHIFYSAAVLKKHGDYCS